MCYNSKWYLYKGWLVVNENKIRKDNKNLKLPHMFQKSFINETAKEHDIYFDNLAKIVKSYRNNKATNYSVLDSIKNLLNDDKIEGETEVRKYIEEIKNKYCDIQHQKTKLEEEETEENIENIIKSSEKVINNSKDQKGLLKNLIDDININSNSTLSYDDEKFASNMAEIINETINEDKSFSKDSIEKQEKNNKEEPRMKKRKSPFIFVILIIIILCITGYYYRDVIVNFIKSF